MRIPPAFAVCLLALPVLAGCTALADTARVFTSVNIAEPESLDPSYDYETAGGGVLQNVYETLVYYHRDSADVLDPVLVTEVPTLENGGLTPDGLTYTFHLRRDVRFSDGSPLTAEDVKYSLDRPILMNDPNSPAWISGSIAGAAAYMASEGTAQDRATYQAAGGVTILDPSTVQVKVESPDPAFLYKIAYTQGSIVSKRAFTAAHAERLESWGVAATLDGLPPATTAGAKAITRDPWADRYMMGTGPFMLDRWIPGDKVILRRNPHYTGEQKPSVEAVLLLKVNDLNTRILLLQRREADDIYVSPGEVTQVQGKSFARIIEQPGFAIVTGVFTRHVTDNQECPVDARGAPDCDFFSDLHMRKAFSLAMDYDKFVRDVAKHHVIQLTSVVPKGMFGKDDANAGYHYDLAAARAELAQSKHPDGFKIKIHYNTGNTLREGAAQLMKQGLEAMSPNIQAEVTPLDWATALLPNAKKSGFAMYFIGWSPDYAFPDDYVKPFGDPRAGQYAKWAQYNDPALLAKIDQALVTIDPGAVKAQYRDIQQHMTDNYDYLYLFQQNNVHVQGPWVRGYFFNPMDSNQPLVGHYQYVSKV